MNIMSVARFVLVVALCAAMPAIVCSQDAKPQMIPIDKFDYFDDGKVMACSKLTPEGRLVGKLYYYHDGKIRKVERYDKSENKIEEANYDEGGKLDDNVDGWAAKGWTYKDGTLRAESTYGEDGHLTERKIYNEEGDMVDRQYVGDGVIDPSEEYNRGSIVTDETDQFFDKYGRPTGSVTTEIDDPDDM